MLSHDVRVNSYADVDSSVIFSHVNIGRHCRIRHAIIDRDVHIPDGTVIGYDPAEDKKNYFVSPSGLTVVTRDYSVYENPVSPDFLQMGIDRVIVRAKKRLGSGLSAFCIDGASDAR